MADHTITLQGSSGQTNGCRIAPVGVPSWKTGAYLLSQELLASLLSLAALTHETCSQFWTVFAVILLHADLMIFGGYEMLCRGLVQVSYNIVVGMPAIDMLQRA